MEKFQELLLGFAKKRWFSTSGLLSAVALGAIITLPVIPIMGFVSAFFLFGCFLCIITVIWGKFQFRVPKNKLGIVLALSHENSPDSERIYSDLVQRFRESFAQNEMFEAVVIHQLPVELAREIKIAKEAAQFCERGNYAFIMYGEIRYRTIDEIENGIVDIRCLARHAQLTPENQKAFGHVLTSTFGNRILIPDGEFLLTEVAAQHLHAATKYILGLCLIFAQHYDWGEQYLLEARAEALRTAGRLSLPNDFSVPKSINKQLETLYLEFSRYHQERWREMGDSSHLQAAAPYIQKLRDLNPEIDSSRTAMAVQSFLIDRNITYCIKELEKCADQSSFSWLCNMAFLRGYEGHIEQCFRLYRRAERTGIIDPTILPQCEEFINLILADEPEHLGLHFCLGVINYKLKDDLQSALVDLNNFIKFANPTRNAKHISIVNTWLLEIDGIERRA